MTRAVARQFAFMTPTQRKTWLDLRLSAISLHAQAVLGRDTVQIEDLLEISRPADDLSSVHGVYVDLVRQDEYWYIYVGSGTGQKGLWQRLKEYASVVTGTNKPSTVRHEKLIARKDTEANFRVVATLPIGRMSRQEWIVTEGYWVDYLRTLSTTIVPGDSFWAQEHIDRAVEDHEAIGTTVWGPETSHIGSPLNFMSPYLQTSISRPDSEPCVECERILETTDDRLYLVNAAGQLGAGCRACWEYLYLHGEHRPLALENRLQQRNAHPSKPDVKDPNATCHICLDQPYAAAGESAMAPGKSLWLWAPLLNSWCCNSCGGMWKIFMSATTGPIDVPEFIASRRGYKALKQQTMLSRQANPDYGKICQIDGLSTDNQYGAVAVKRKRSVCGQDLIICDPCAKAIKRLVTPYLDLPMDQRIVRCLGDLVLIRNWRQQQGNKGGPTTVRRWREILHPLQMNPGKYSTALRYE